MDADRASFDLVEQPWILVHRLDGQVEEVSLRELFARAQEFRSVLGELPTQAFAVVRLLLAILHRAVDGPSAERWALLWREPTLPIYDISAYLQEFRERFDLLSPETPFYQVADLRTANDSVSSLDKLIADVPVGAHYFTTRLKSGVDRLGFAEAARWVVHCQAFDPSGIKSGAVGDDRVKNGKGYPIGTGWAGMLGGVLAEGATLKETLLLNLVPLARLQLDPGAQDLPAWERDPTTAEPEFTDGHAPTGPVQLYTWQSRRIRLFHDQRQVHGVLIANGDRITPQNQHWVEPMSVWRRSQAQEKKTGVVPTFMPRAHDPERAIWRGLAALLHDTWGLATSAKDAPSLLRPAVLRWLDDAREDGLLPDDYQIRTRTVGMEYGSQSSTTAEIIDDAVAVAVVLLGEAGQQLRATAVDAVSVAEHAAAALAQLAGNLAVAAGGEGSGPTERARELAYSQLDRPFREWLARLCPDSSPTDVRQQWQQQADRIVRKLGRELVEQSGQAAWRGREGRGGRLVNTPQADLWFRAQLRRHLPYAHTESPDRIADEKTEVAA